MQTVNKLGDQGEMKITGDCEDLLIPFAWAAFGGSQGLDADIAIADPLTASTNLTNANDGTRNPPSSCPLLAV